MHEISNCVVDETVAQGGLSPLSLASIVLFNCFYTLSLGTLRSSLGSYFFTGFKSPHGA